MKQRNIAALIFVCVCFVIAAALPVSAQGLSPVSFLPIVRRDVYTTPTPSPSPSPTAQATFTPVPTTAPAPTAAPTTNPQPPNPPGGIPWCAGSTGTTRVGAICNDGSSSTSTGSGTCSRHGGVRCWIGR